MVKEHLSLLGKRCRDKVTGMEGVITCMSFDLYGCIQAVLHPGIDKDGKPRDTHWFDVSRLEKLSEIPVMLPPDFAFGDVAEGKKGPSEKPAFMKI